MIKYIEDTQLDKVNSNICAIALILYEKGAKRKYIKTYTQWLQLFETYFGIEVKDKRKSKYIERANELRKTHVVIDNPTEEKAPYTRN